MNLIEKVKFIVIGEDEIRIGHLIKDYWFKGKFKLVEPNGHQRSIEIVHILKRYN
jgi:hypothetical protein